MSARPPAGTEQPTTCFDLDVCELQRARHSRAERQDPTKRVHRVPDVQLLGEVHETAALGVYRTTRVREFANCGRRARVLGELFCMELRISTTEVKPIQVGR